VRIDVDDPGKAGTHGWQVRFGPRPWKLFSDAKAGKRRTPRVSLKEAVQYLTGIYTGPPPLVRSTPTPRKRNPIQEAGLRLVERTRKGRNVVEIWVEAVSPTREIAPRRYYAGTQNSVTPEKMELAIENARRARAVMVNEYLANQRRRGWR